MKNELEKFGSFFVRNLRDRMLYDLDMLLSSKWKTPELEGLQQSVSKFSVNDKEVIREVVDRVITSGMHDLLFALQEESDAGGSIRVFADGQEVAQLSDGLHGEIFGDDGWIVRYSEYPADREKERSQWAQKEIENLGE
ncbi:MAG: hypothetical protein PHP95_10870 [Desulfuromonadaceae bacterium]|nr:hypothetical protein [Desulfuromonadaceae bacterium]MDD2848948.1 hypothetical protein [Desulfuromonadaceae bacterium]MDD4130297.1 hypothetical protein [Desulfuromonadaceae bacterium]